MFDFVKFACPTVLASKAALVRYALSGAACAALLSAAPALAGFFTPGRIVVVRVGDGSAALGSASTAVFLDEYDAAGTLTATLPLPTTASGPNQALTNAGSSTSEGFLNLSTNGLYFMQAGYATAPGTASVAGTTTAAVNRVIARIDMGGIIDTSTALSDLSYSGSNIRSATSTDGTQFWTAGTATTGANGGVRYIASLGATTSTQLSSSVTNTRVVRIFGGQLYVSSASSTFQGVSAVGTGLPTTSGQTITLLPGFPTATGPSTYDYFFANANTLYVADDRTNGSGGIQKWTLSAGTWTLVYTLAPSPTVGARGLTGAVLGSQTVLFATTTNGQIVRVVDLAAMSVFSTVATAPTNTAFRGIRLVPITCGGGPDCNANGVADTCDIALGFSSDANGDAIPDDCQTGSVRYCFGDAGCPCGNNSLPASNQGCRHNATTGATLTGSGTTDVSSDTFVLTATNLPAVPSSILFFQGDASTNVAFNDGKRCVTGTQIRLAIKVHPGLTSTYPQGGDMPISVKGMVPAAGGARYYQAWFRTFPSLCGFNSNLTNGVFAPWVP